MALSSKTSRNLAKERAHYNTLNHGVDSAELTPLDPRILAGAAARIEDKLKHSDELRTILARSLTEAEDDYKRAMRKWRLNQSLVDPRKGPIRRRRRKPFPGLQMRMGQREFGIVKRRLEKNLHLSNGHLQRALTLCYDNFCSKRLIDIGALTTGKNLQISNLPGLVKFNLKQEEEALKNSFYPKIIALFGSGPSARIFEQSESFRACLKCIVEQSLQAQILASLEEWSLLMRSELPPRFAMQLTLDQAANDEADRGTLEFYPSKDELTNVIVNIGQSIANALNTIPTVETLLLPSSEKKCLNTALPEHIASPFYTQLKTTVNELFKGAEDELNTLITTYGHLFDGSDESENVKFVSGVDFDFDLAVAKITQYQQIIAEIAALPVTRDFTIVILDYEDAKRSITAIARRHAAKIVSALLTRHVTECDAIISEFEMIKAKAEKEPDDTEELIEIQNYILAIKGKRLQEIDLELEEMLKRMMYLLDVHLFTPADIEKSSITFSWPKNIEPIFLHNAHLIEKANNEKQAALREKREMLIADIEKEQVRLGEFDECGDYDSIKNYVADCGALSKRLAQYALTIEAINREESLFKWEQTSYPALEKVSTELVPYHNYFNTLFKWQKSSKAWSDGEFLKLNPESIETELDELFRELYKSNKFFTNKIEQAKKESGQKEPSEPAKNVMLGLCASVMGDVKEFKKDVPLISILCNPGIRERHWHKMSDICGRDITPDAGTTLRKMKKMGLEEFMEQFESISGAASKEFSLEKTLAKMSEEWEPISFNLVEYRDGVFILAGIDEIQTLLDDQIVKTQTMRGSPFIKPIEEETKTWENKLHRIEDTLDEWLVVQSQWLYLEPIFSSADIMAQMPEEGRMFQQVDRTWHEVMGFTQQDTAVLVATSMPNLLEKLRDAVGLLDLIMKGLNASCP